MLPLVIAPAALQMLLLVLTGWLERRERVAIAYLIEENRFCILFGRNARLQLLEPRSEQPARRSSRFAS